jgi:hypothetical protein
MSTFVEELAGEEGDMRISEVLTMRDYFAAMAMDAYLSGAHHDAQLGASANTSDLSYFDAVAQIAYATADAMLKARVKP